MTKVYSITELYHVKISVFNPGYPYERLERYDDYQALVSEYEMEFSEVADEYTKVHLHLRGDDIPTQIQSMVEYLEIHGTGPIIYSPPWELTTWSGFDWENVYFYFPVKNDALMFKLKWA